MTLHSIKNNKLIYCVCMHKKKWVSPPPPSEPTVPERGRWQVRISISIYVYTIYIDIYIYIYVYIDISTHTYTKKISSEMIWILCPHKSLNYNSRKIPSTLWKIQDCWSAENFLLYVLRKFVKPNQPLRHMWGKT